MSPVLSLKRSRFLIDINLYSPYKDREFSTNDTDFGHLF